MLSVGCKVSLANRAVFYYCQDGSLQGIIAVHVDDFFWAGLNIFKCNVISKLPLHSNTLDWMLVRMKIALSVCCRRNILVV